MTSIKLLLGGKGLITIIIHLLKMYKKNVVKTLKAKRKLNCHEIYREQIEQWRHLRRQQEREQDLLSQTTQQHNVEVCTMKENVSNADATLQVGE